MMHGRLKRHLRRPHARLVHGHVALLEIATGTCGDDIDPGRVPPAGARQQMIEGKIIARTAVLAAEFVSQKYVKTREGRLGGRLYESLERYHAGKLHLPARAAYRALVFGDDVYAFQEYGLDRVLPRPQRQRIIAKWPEIGVEHQRRKSTG